MQQREGKQQRQQQEQEQRRRAIPQAQTHMATLRQRAQAHGCGHQQGTRVASHRVGLGQGGCCLVGVQRRVGRAG